MSGLQIYSIARLFGVRVQKSSNADCFHEKFHLTELVAQSNSGMLTRHGDMLVCFAAYVTVPESPSAPALSVFCPLVLREKDVELFAQGRSLCVSCCAVSERVSRRHQRTKDVELLKSECPLLHGTWLFQHCSVPAHFSHMEHVSF